MNQFFDDEDDGKDLEMETKPRRRVKNSDNDPLFLHPESEGYISNEVNGADTEEVPLDVPTRLELVMIVKYWYGRTLGNDFFRFKFGGFDKKEIQMQHFVTRRISGVAAAIGQETVNQAIEEVREEFKAKVDPRLWNIFEDGSDEEWREVREEFRREEWEDYSASYLREMETLETKYPNDMVALVLRDPWADKDRAVLISSAADPELIALLQADGRLEIETDRSRVTTLVVDHEFGKIGFLRIRRENGRWIFTDPYTEEDPIKGAYFQWSLGPIVSVLKACMGAGTDGA